MELKSVESFRRLGSRLRPVIAPDGIEMPGWAPGTGDYPAPVIAPDGIEIRAGGVAQRRDDPACNRT